MPDAKVSDLTAIATAADADVIYIVQGGVSKKATIAQLKALVIGRVFEGTWAALLAGYAASAHSGKTAVVIDPTYFTNPLRVRSDGTKWRLDGWQDLWVNITPMTGGAGTVTTEQLQKQWTAPAGFLTCLRQLRIGRVDYKTATSDTFVSRTRIGAGVTPLTDTMVLASGGLISTTRTEALQTLLTFPSATQARVLGAQNGANDWIAGPSSVAYPNNFTIPDSDAANTVISCTMQLTTGTDSSASGQAHLVITGS